ncbi:MAG: virulence factor [Caldilineaceae bacterium]
MAEYQITYWREFPSMVTAREGRRNTAKAQLGQRFMLAIDEAAMRLNLGGTDAYLDQWRKSDWQTREGDPEAVAQAVAEELEAKYPQERLLQMLRELKQA